MSKMDEHDFVETGNWQLCAKWGQRALPDERAEAVRQLLEKEQTVEQIVSRFNLSSVQVAYGWMVAVSRSAYCLIPPKARG